MRDAAVDVDTERTLRSSLRGSGEGWATAL
jgi:hypothetical protein